MMLIPLVFIFIISVPNIFKHPFIIYLPFKIPGKQIAITLLPFGIFIESELKRYDSRDPCKHPLTHEMVHWNQYQRMGLFSFHYNYLKYYLKSGRINNPMEDEARKPCNSRKR